MKECTVGSYIRVDAIISHCDILSEGGLIEIKGN